MSAPSVGQPEADQVLPLPAEVNVEPGTFCGAESRSWRTAINRFELALGYRSEGGWRVTLYNIAPTCVYATVQCADDELDRLAAVHCVGQLAAMAAAGVPA